MPDRVVSTPEYVSHIAGQGEVRMRSNDLFSEVKRREFIKRFLRDIAADTICGYGNVLSPRTLANEVDKLLQSLCVSVAKDELVEGRQVGPDELEKRLMDKMATIRSYRYLSNETHTVGRA